MSSHLAAGKTLELLDTLKGTVEAFAARADKLSADFRAQTTKESRRCDVAVEEQTRQLAAALGGAESAFHNAKTAAVSKYEQRKARLGRAYQSSKEQGLKQIEERLGARKYELQKRMLQAERDRDAALAGATAAIEEYRNHLGAEQENLARLEQAARRALKGYRRLARLLVGARQKTAADLPPDDTKLLACLREMISRAAGELGRLQGFLLLRLLGVLPAWLWLGAILVALPLVPVLQHFGIHSFDYRLAGVVAALGAALLGLRYWAQRRATSLAGALADLLAEARRTQDAAHQISELHYQQELERVKAAFIATTQESDQQLKQALAQAADQRVACRMENDERTVRANTQNERMHRARLDQLGQQHTQTTQQLRQTAEVRTRALKNAWEEKRRKFEAEYAANRHTLETEWKQKMTPLYEGFGATQTQAAKLFPSWDSPAWANWTPPAQFARATQFGRLEVNVHQLCAAVPKPQELALPGPAQFAVPLCLAYPEQGSILFETEQTGHEQAIDVLNNIILRLLSNTPPGRLNFTILDPVGLGQNFAGVMHLADYEDQLINSRIWTQSSQIEEKLADLNEHMEKVIQMYLRNEYQTIAEYNEQAGVIAEKYHFLVVADFPSNFTDTSAKRLLSIAASGARCGVYTLIHWDHRQPLPQEFIPDELRSRSVCISCKGSDFIVTNHALPGTRLLLEAPPAADQATEFIHRVGRFSRDSSRVEVPFEHVAPSPAEVWTEETANELRVPIGRTGATKLQYLAIGKGTRQHGLIAGKTGSGKSTLFHVIITNLALWCSPEQVEFYLVDFKKGVEFKCYAARRLPHARVVAIESDREFGLSVLQRVDDELKRRGDLFRQLGVQDLPGYKRAGGTEAIPRTLLLIDEFQEFFVEDDKVSQTASLLLDRIVRQGRAFGIHVLLGSQTLGGAYTVARTTLGQMVIRIALQCNEADAYLIMDDSNPAPRLLSRPGEGIYNDMAGALEGNSPFQVVWLPDQVRDARLAAIRERADKPAQRQESGPGEAYPGPIVFEGNAPADVRENSPLRGFLNAAVVKPTSAGRIWLGAPNSIKGPTEVVFNRQSGNNLLIVGQRDETVLAMLAISLVSLAAQYPRDGARFILCDATPPGTPQRALIEGLTQMIPQGVTLAKPGALPELLKGLAVEKKARADAVDIEAAAPVFLFIHELQKYGKLRYEDTMDFDLSIGDAEKEANPAVVLHDLICEGPRLGFHVIATCDTYNNVSRSLGRKALSEFEMRVLFQMSANDSASLIDNPKAGMLGLHRALLFNAQEGYLETFRPYALPAAEWFEETGRSLRRLAGPC